MSTDTRTIQEVVRTASVPNKHLLMNVTVSEVFPFTDILQHRIELLRWRMGAMIHRSRSKTGRWDGENIIPVIIPNKEVLVQYFEDHLRDRHMVAGVSDLPSRYRDESDLWRKLACVVVRRKMILMVLNDLEIHSLLWWSEDGYWEFAQSFIDEYLSHNLRHGELVVISERKRRKFVNDRSWHGRPNNTRQSDTPPGASIGRACDFAR